MFRHVRAFALICSSPRHASKGRHDHWHLSYPLLVLALLLHTTWRMLTSCRQSRPSTPLSCGDIYDLMWCVCRIWSVAAAADSSLAALVGGATAPAAAQTSPRAPRQRGRPPRLLQAFRQNLAAIPEELDPPPGRTAGGVVAHVAAASAASEQITKVADSCGTCAKGTARFADGPAWPGAASGVLTSVAQHRMTLRFKDADLERHFNSWHVDQQRMVRAALRCPLHFCCVERSLMTQPRVTRLASPLRDTRSTTLCILCMSCLSRQGHTRTCDVLSVFGRLMATRCAVPSACFRRAKGTDAMLLLQTDFLTGALFFVAALIVGFRPPYNQLVRLCVPLCKSTPSSPCHCCTSAVADLAAIMLAACIRLLRQPWGSACVVCHCYPVVSIRANLFSGLQHTITCVRMQPEPRTFVLTSAGSPDRCVADGPSIPSGHPRLHGHVARTISPGRACIARQVLLHDQIPVDPRHRMSIGNKALVLLLLPVSAPCGTRRYLERRLTS